MPIKNILYPKKIEIIDHYALKTGFSTQDIDWYYAFGAFKLAVIILHSPPHRRCMNW